MGLSCHGILQAGFLSVFQKGECKKKTCRASDVSDILNVFSPNDRDVVASGNETESPFTFPDVPVAKIQGVRAAKSETWLRRPETLSEIVSAILSTEPVFHLSTWFLKQQEDQTWLSEDPTRRPLVNLVTPRFSPVVRAIASCFDMLLAPDSEDGPFAFLRGVLNVLGGGDAGQ